MAHDEGGGGSYEGDGTLTLEAIWGDGFLSPGGADEVRRIVSGGALTGAEVLDIGCGTGGAALTLAVECGARSVTGIDVEPFVIDRATEEVLERGLHDTVQFLVVPSGPLPFPDEAFDIVFSKDTILHVRDKEALLSEAYRVLRPGGRLCVGDWLRGGGAELDPLVDAFVESSGEEFFMVTLGETAAAVASVGFVDVEQEDRCDWYHTEALAELARLRGPLRDGFVERFGAKAFDGTVGFWEVLVESTANGVLRPGIVRARKP